ncbi:hypothetical protein LZQ00_08605 [Sphingobacterium sp. SRCM116780]|uniref:hypothetical protein n=1 Tax=Sphingobacterium sp. SRCM116780 TaxID=2907623 RepID=UPI001F214429|nr:hypothetical protein [Sphingobacterium sp. SRCM116780]UIR57866.1 hypothetical protein LZQ00_08605 [Sphingobacterium sp. SRCM116780]
MKILSLVVLLIICSFDSRNNQKIKQDAPHQDSILKENNVKDTIIFKDYYHYSFENDANIILTFTYDTLITDKGVFPVKVIWDSKELIRYDLLYKNKVIGMVVQDPTDDNESVLTLYIDSAYVTNHNDWFKLYRTDNKKLSQLPLVKTKLDFLKKYKIIE